MQRRYVYTGIGLGFSSVLSIILQCTIYTTSIEPISTPPTQVSATTCNVTQDNETSESASKEEKIVDLTKTLVVEKGDTLHHLLLRAGLSKEDTQLIASSLRRVFEQRDLKVGQNVNLVLRPQAEGESVQLISLSLSRNLEEEVALKRNDKGNYEASLVKIPLHRVTKYIEGKIGTSLYHAALKQGVPAAVVREAIKVLSYEVNLSHDPKTGDPFMLIYDVYENDKGDTVKPGELHYVAFSPGGRRSLQMYGYKPTNGSISYFNQHGISVVKTFLRTPLDSTHLRITSRFSAKRHHPILGFSRAHKGIDYKAAVGTAVLAAASGVVVKAGRFGDYGNYIRIRHSGGYETAYAHLKVITVKHGERISQGAMIGRVGLTGLTTGAHLHHEVIFKGTQINPAGLIHMPTHKLSGHELKRFMDRLRDINRILLNHTPNNPSLQPISYRPS